MTLFRSDTHRDLWRMRWCETCFQPEEAARRLHGKDVICPIWEQAMRTGRKPRQWERKPRADEMVRTIKCNEHTAAPPVTRRAKAQCEDVPLFDVTPYATDVGYVPVAGWPERPTKDGVNHS